MLARAAEWIGERWPVAALRSLLLDERIPGGARYAYSTGALVLAVFGVQAATGLAQLLFYAPTVDHAYDSVCFLRTRVAFGWLIHGLHVWGATAMVALVLAHLATGFLWGAYKRPRELTWLAGCGLLAVVLGFAFTGGPLQWDQKGYWAAQVGTSVAGSVPLVGGVQKLLLRGGESMGQLTLTRFFALHVLVLPALLLGLAALHIVAMRRFGLSGPWDEGRRTPDGPFWPDQVFKDTVAISLALLALVALAALAPPGYAGPADTLDVAYVPKPDWEFLFLYQSLKYFSGPLEPLGTVGVPAALAALLLLLPFVDRRPERNPLRRPLALAAGVALAATLTALSVAGHRSPGFAGNAAADAGAVWLPAAGAGSSATAAASGAAPGRAAAIIGNAERGAQLFAADCAGCHGPRGARGVPNPGSADGAVPTLAPIDPELRDPDPARFAEHIDTFIQHGSVPAGGAPAISMPAFGDANALTQPAIANLEAYLLGLNGVDRGRIVEPGMEPGTFLLLVAAAYALIALVAGGARQKLADAAAAGPQGGARP